MSHHGESDQDYYRILGVLRTATPADIQSAYYLLAMQHHPDVSPASDESLARLKRINEAYEVLSDEEKRHEYDRRHGSLSSPQSAPRGFPTRASSAFARSETPTAAIPAGFVAELPITPEEARYGGVCEFTLTLREACAVCAGHGRVAGSGCDVCRGHGWIRQRRRLQIRLPGGVQTDTVIRLTRPDARWLASAGELLLRIKVRPCW